MRLAAGLGEIPLGALPAALAWKTGRKLRARSQRRLARRLAAERSPAQVAWREGARFFQFADIEARPEAYRQFLAQAFPGAVRQAVEAAGLARDHVFDLLGSGPTHLGDRIPWNRDWKSGKVWEPRYFADIPEIDLSDSSDIKVPWELSRFYHAVPLGKAWFLTGDERWAEELAAQVSDWIDANPPLHGVNWHCAMEVAVRAVNWLWGWHFIRGSAAADGIRPRLLASLHEHGRYIEANLEFDKRVFEGRYVRMNHNHYLADLVGLAYLGTVLDGPDANRWLRFARRELTIEIERQFLEDGAHWELALSYHRLSTEMCLSALILLAGNGMDLSPTARARLRESLAFIQGYSRPDGLAPLVRDADDGRLHLLGGRPFRDHRGLLAVGAVFFGAPELMRGSGSASEETLWLLGLDGARAAEAAAADPSPGADRQAAAVSRAFPHAGYYVMRAPGDVHVFACCAGIGMKGAHGGHAHSDCLGFEAYAQGTSILTDSGTYVYSADPARRNLFRSTASHNTFRVDGEEITRFSPASLFGMRNDARPKVVAWETSAAFDRLCAEHTGYERLPQPVTCRRTFLLDKDSGLLLVTDELGGRGEHQLEVFLHLGPGLVTAQAGPGLYQLRGPGAAALVWLCDAAGWDLREEATHVSPRYGVLVPNVTLSARRRAHVPLVFRWALGLAPRWGEMGGAAPAVEAVRAIAHRRRDSLPPQWKILLEEQ